MPTVFPHITLDFLFRWLAITIAALSMAVIVNYGLRKARVRLAGLAGIVLSSFSAALIGNALFPSLLLTTPDIWVFMLYGSAFGFGVFIYFELAYCKSSTRLAYLQSVAITVLMGMIAGFLAGLQITGLPVIAALTVFGTITGSILALPYFWFAFRSRNTLPRKNSPSDSGV